MKLMLCRDDAPVATKTGRRPFDLTGRHGERGFTLPALIIMSVFALLAVGAGVVIVAITRNSSDNLSSQTFSVDGNPCNEVEIYSIEQAALGIIGSNKGQRGSAVGCVPVCFLDFRGSEPRGSTLSLRITMAVEPDVQVDVLSNTWQYSDTDAIGQALWGLTWRAEVRRIGRWVFNEGLQEVTGNILFQELPGKVFLMQDKTHFFAADVPEGLQFDKYIKFVNDYEVLGVRVNRNRDACEIFDALGTAGERDER